MKFGSGVNVNSPVLSTVRVPLPGIVAVVVKVPTIPSMVNCVTVKVEPASRSESFVNTFTVTGVSSGVVLLSSLTAIGSSFIGVMVMVKVLETVAPVAAPLLSSVMV